MYNKKPCLYMFVDHRIKTTRLHLTKVSDFQILRVRDIRKKLGSSLYSTSENIPNVNCPSQSN